MNDLRSFINEKLMTLLQAHFPSYSGLLFNLTIVLWITSCTLILHLIFHRFVLRVLGKFHLLERSGSWLNAFSTHRLFHNVVLIIQSTIIQIQAKAWLEKTSALNKFIVSISDLAMLFFGLLAVFSILNAVQSMMNSRSYKTHLPVRGVIQSTKLVLSLIFGLVSIAILLGKSPVILLSGIGALSAVLMLVFKDPILGLVAGVQLSANNMLKIGDWLEMPRHSADGDVIDIGLTTVKVQNWDKTITTIPTYALISDSFKNWRGMSESGGRRIKRSLLINTSSIKFLTTEDIARLKKSNLLVSYLEDKLGALEKENLNEDMSCGINGKRLTNIGTFRKYLVSYLKSHPKIQQEMTLMVRQLPPSNVGLPIEIYAFTNTTDWEAYEEIQSDIFDHIFAILIEFELIAHESPIGNDIRMISSDLK